MDHLDPKAFYIFYFHSLQMMLISLLISIPIGLIILTPMYFISTYIGYTDFVLTIIQVCMIFIIVYFTLFPLLWGYLGYFRSRIKADTHGIYFERGVLLHQKTAIPYNNIQSIAVVKSNIMEILGLCSIQIDHIINSQKRPLIISGLSVYQAQYMRNTYLENMKTPDQIS